MALCLNEQDIVPTRFAALRYMQKQEKDKLRIILLADFCHLLPEELWDIILSMAFLENQIVAYFAFKRKDTIYNDDHYMFKGTEKEWPLAIEHMQSVVSPYDEYDDIPTDTYCCGLCDNPDNCLDERGNKCGCRWSHRVFVSDAASIRYITAWTQKTSKTKKIVFNSILYNL
jgi:hypothetical protein